MNRFRILAVGAMLCGIVSPTFAAVQLRLDDGTTTITISDNGAGDSNPLLGAITFIGSIGTFIINVSTGVGSAVLGPASMDLNSINTVNAAGGTLTIDFTETNVSPTFPGFQLDFGGTISSGGSVTARAWFDATNTAFGTASLIGMLGPFTTPSFSQTLIGPGPGSAPYSLTQRLVISFPAGGGPRSFSGNFALTPIPEPASVVLFGAVLLVTTAVLRRRVSRA